MAAPQSGKVLPSHDASASIARIGTIRIVRRVPVFPIEGMTTAPRRRYDFEVSPYRTPGRPLVVRTELPRRTAPMAERRPSLDWWTIAHIGLWTVRIAIGVFGGV